jgi:hypothetical protein
LGSLGGSLVSGLRSHGGILTVVDWVAITGIVVSGLLGPSISAAWVYRNQRVRFKQELTLHDRAELRILVDEVAQALERADIGIRLAIIATTQAAERKVDERLRADFDSVSMLRERLAMRLGMNHDVTRNLDAALKELRWVSMSRKGKDAENDPATKFSRLLYCQERYREHRSLVLAFALPLVASRVEASHGA